MPPDARPLPVISSAFRTKLAEAVATRFEKFDPRDPVREFLMAADPVNCGAQIVLYENPNTSRDTRSKLEQQFAGYSSLALYRLIGLADDASTSAASPGFYGGPPPFFPGGAIVAAVPAADFTPQLVTALWSPQFRTLFDPQLDDARPWDKQPQSALLAGTIPEESTRVALCKAFRKHWSDGPKALEAAGWIDRMTTDPALLVFLKMNPRKDVKTQPGRPPVEPPRPPAVGGNSKVEAARAKKASQAQAEVDWMAVSSKLVTTWCRRLNTMIVAKEKAAAEAGQTIEDEASKLPPDIKLDPGAKVIVACHIVWPDQASPAFSESKPGSLDLYYVRAQQAGKMKNVVTSYSRQAKAKASEAHTIDKGTWIDSLRPPQNDRRRSIDVLIMRPGEGGASPAVGPPPGQPGGADSAKDEEETDLTVEILSIEIKDPLARE